MGDRQTTGGYTKIASIIRPDIPALAQARAGDRVRFRQVGLPEAHAALAAFVARLREMEAAVAAPPARATLHVTMNGERRVVEVEEIPAGFAVDVGGREFEVRLAPPAEAAGGAARVCSPVPGVVAQVHVAPGAAVAPGARLVTLLAMKLQHDVSPRHRGRRARGPGPRGAGRRAPGGDRPGLTTETVRLFDRSGVPSGRSAERSNFRTSWYFGMLHAAWQGAPQPRHAAHRGGPMLTSRKRRVARCLVVATAMADITQSPRAPLV